MASNLIEPITLASLHARLRAGIVQYAGGRTEASDELSFDCPKCRGHRIVIYRAFDHSKGLNNISITPHRASALQESGICGVVHFFIIDGRVHPAGSCGGWDD